MKILAFLQNQWFRDPERVKKIYDSKPMKRRALNKAFLFAGCLSGRRLRAAFGDLCNKIEWEEISPLVGSQSSSAFPPDHEHIKMVIDDVKPDYIVVFGKLAQEALESHLPKLPQPILHCPHPAARGNRVPSDLSAAAMVLRACIEEFERKQLTELHVPDNLPDQGE